MELVLPMYNMPPYFSLKNLGKKVRTTHDKIRCLYIELQVDLCPSPGGSAARPWLYPSAVTRRTQGTLRGCASQLQSHFSTVRGMHLETLPWAYLGINSRLDWGTLYDRDSVPHSTFSCGWLPNLLGSSVHFLVKSSFSKNC